MNPGGGDGGGAGARPDADIQGGRVAHRRLLETVAALTDDDVGRPSRLAGWTVGHVLAHLARNADSHVGMLVAAARGEVAAQYPRGATQRADDIAAGARRPARELVADVAATTARLEATWDAMAPDVWQNGWGRMAVAGEVRVAELPFRRWRETEIHHRDLGLGFGVDDWSAPYVDRELGFQLAALASRLLEGAAVEIRATDTRDSWVVAPPGASEPVVVSAPRRRIVAWLVGRDAPPGAPALGPWS